MDRALPQLAGGVRPPALDRAMKQMSSVPAYPDILDQVSLAGLEWIDAGLEGAWSETARVIWRPGARAAELSGLPSHEAFVPAIELVFPGHWIGIRCARRIDGRNVFDEDSVCAIVETVQRRTTRPG